MKKFVSSTIVMAIMASNIAMAETGDPIQNSHRVQIPDKRTGKTIEGIGGLKREPTTGKMVKYRTFTDPLNGDVVEQYIEGKDSSGQDLIRTVRSRQTTPTPIQSETETIVNNDSHLSAESKASKYIAIGAAVAAVVGIGLIARTIRTGRKTPREQNETDAEGRRSRPAVAVIGGRPAPLKNMPTQINLSADVPGGKGQKVNVAGAVPSGSVPTNVPRFQTASGQYYIVQQNPETNMFETILLYDMLTRPYYYPGFYSYSSFGHSPYIYSGEGIVYNEAVANTQREAPVWSTEAPAERTAIVSAETFTHHRQVVSDITQSASQSDFGSVKWASSEEPSSTYRAEESAKTENTDSSGSSSSNTDSSSGNIDFGGGSSGGVDSSW